MQIPMPETLHMLLSPEELLLLYKATDGGLTIDLLNKMIE